jgi:L-lactate dehydrogenase (cytochrome)
MDLQDKYPSLDALKKRAKRRLPHFAWEYLDSATGKEQQMARNRQALDQILFDTQILRGERSRDLTTELMGQTYALPFGIAPVGMSGLIWPNAEQILAQSAVRSNIPFCLSTVATQTPEDLSPHIGQQGWFQLYPPKDLEIRADLLARAKKAGFHTLILTVDVPVASRRERQRKAKLTIPAQMDARLFLDCMLHPEWSLRTLAHGSPSLKTVEKYAPPQVGAASTAHVGYIIRGAPDWDYLQSLREEWTGNLVVKGVTTAKDAEKLVTCGVDAVWISNHSGRQFDGGPASIDTLPEIRAVVPASVPLIFDSGVEGGLDILRAIALGADFVMLGRAFHYGIAALGTVGADHVVHMLKEDILSNLGQMGVGAPKDAKNCLRSQPKYR